MNKDEFDKLIGIIKEIFNKEKSHLNKKAYEDQLETLVSFVRFTVDTNDEISDFIQYLEKNPNTTVKELFAIAYNYKN